MAIEFKLPDIGEGLADGEIIKWLVSEGDQVEEDQPLVEVLTDKATVEIPSPYDGRILKLCAGEGDVVAIGSAILLFAESDQESAEDLAAEPEALDEQPLQTYESPAVESLDEHPIQAYAEVAAFVVDEESLGAEDDIERAREMARAERSAVEAEVDVYEVPAAMPAPVEGRILATPATRRLANELGIDIALVPGSGLDGRVMKEDVRAFVEGGLPEVPAAEPEPLSADEAGEVIEAPVVAAAPAPPAVEPPAVGPPEIEPPAVEPPAVEPPAVEPPAVETPVVEAPAIQPPAAEPPAKVAPATRPATAAPGAEERIPLRGLRRTIAERMVLAKHSAPHYTYVEEADMEEVVQLRAEAKGLAAEHGVKLTYLPFIVRALTMALKKHPYLNASLDEEAGEIPKAFIALKPGAEATAEEIMEFVAGQVSTYKQIRLLEFIDQIPKSASGKILRRELRDR